MDAEDVPTSRGRRKRSRSKSRFNISQAEDIMGEMKAPWMIVAKALEGEAEMAGKAANPRILEMFRVAGLAGRSLPSASDETAWCAAFGELLPAVAGGYQGTSQCAASSFAEFWYRLSAAREGAGNPQPGLRSWLFQGRWRQGLPATWRLFVADDGDCIKVLGWHTRRTRGGGLFSSKSKWRAYR
jgi:hypothetical protein